MECKMPVMMSESEEAKIKEILAEAKSIAIIGLSPDETKDSNRVAKYLIAAGYEVIPVYPKEETILGQKVYRSLGEIDKPIDIINVFRKGEFLASVVDEAKKISPKLIWGQIGCYDDAAEQAAKDAGLNIVTHRCIMIEHRNFFGK